MARTDAGVAAYNPNMRRLLLALLAAMFTFGVVVPAVANPVEVDDDGPCYGVWVKGKYYPGQGLCYLGPPPPD